MVNTDQYMGKNHGRVAAISEGRLDLIEIVPNGRGGWLERPRSISWLMKIEQGASCSIEEFKNSFRKMSKS